MELLRGVFTDAYCYLPWIAGEYGMKLPESYSPKDSCGQEIGLRENIEQVVCYGQDAEILNRGRCLSCKLRNAYSVYICRYCSNFQNKYGIRFTFGLHDKEDNKMTCTNNCKREDPNSVIMGTVATNGITTLDGWYSCIYFFFSTYFAPVFNFP